VRNGGLAIGDEFDWVIKYGNETPVNYGAGGLGNSLNGGQHNVIASAVPFLTLSDTEVHQGMFIDQVVLTSAGQFAMGNRLDNFLSDGLNGGAGGFNTLVGNTGRDSIHGAGSGESTGGDVLIGGTAYGVDNVGFAIRDFASVADGGNGLTRSIFRDTDPIPTNPNGPGTADPSQFWSIPGFYKYGEVFDFSRNRDTLVAGAGAYATLDGGAGHDSLVGSKTENKKLGDNFFVSGSHIPLKQIDLSKGYVLGGDDAKDIDINDAVFGNGGNDTVTFTDSDHLWWKGYLEGETLAMNGYMIAADISNLVLQMGAPTARNAFGNKTSTGYQGIVGAAEEGSNLLVGNEFDNILDGGGVGGENEKGVGIDTLTGGAGSDLFIVSGYIDSAGNKWPTNKNLELIDKGPDAGRFDLTVREWTDADYVLITDFQAGDFLQLDKPASNYWIGSAPTKFGLKSDNVKPGAAREIEFGIYESAAPDQAPNLVAHIKLVDGFALNASDIDASNPNRLAFVPNLANPTGSYFPRNYAGWGTFYQLDGTAFAQNNIVTNLNPYTQQASTASLSDLIGRIEII
jgi:Ca2+-binding RTX toxin-like protein